MARYPSWRDQLPESYIGALKWGTGYNPIHGQHQNAGRALEGIHDIHGNQVQANGNEPVDSDLIDAWRHSYMSEDDPTWDVSFMDAHPNLDDPHIRGDVDALPDIGNGWPNWGWHGGIPGGTGYRSYKVGTNVKEFEAGLIPSETVSEGWINKDHGNILDSRTSDTVQYERQTSFQQRDAIRVNTAAVVRATDSPRESIASRIIGMKVKEWSGGQRHEDMYPQEQTQSYRGWRARTMGVGPASWMQTNDMYVSEPLTRTVPADVPQGSSPETLATDDGYGYQDGDYYA